MKNLMHTTTKLLVAFAAVALIAGCRTSSCPLTGYRVGDPIDTSEKDWTRHWGLKDVRTSGIVISPDCDITLEAKDGRLVGTIIWYECKTVAERDHHFEEVKNEIIECYKDFLVACGAKESKVIIRGLKETPFEGSSLLPGFHFTCRTPEYDKEICKKFGPTGY